jgi:hypothetical protein
MTVVAQRQYRHSMDYLGSNSAKVIPGAMSIRAVEVLAGTRCEGFRHRITVCTLQGQTWYKSTLRSTLATSMFHLQRRLSALRTGLHGRPWKARPGYGPSWSHDLFFKGVGRVQSPRFFVLDRPPELLLNFSKR